MKKFIRLIIFFLLLLFSCQSDPENVTENQGLSINNEAEIPTGMLDINNTYNQLSLFLAGESSTTYKKNQDKQYYKNYKSKLNESWDKTSAIQLKNIDLWAKKNNLKINDSLPLFYPFSGPDFLYADAFFPNTLTYILVGLENPGKLPNLTRMNDGQISKYLYQLYHSLRYINQAGYFSTSQMQDDFSDSSLNGIMHLICFYFAKTGHQIAAIDAVQIDHYGEEKEKRNFEVADKYINGIKFSFYAPIQKKLKTLYYFPLDLSDDNLKDQFGFVTFLSKFGEKNTFLKSASYLPHNKEFSIICELILKQSKTIIQDDTGIPFKLLKNSGYSVQLFGNYSRTIEVFKNNYQPDLNEALALSNAPALPFKLGYNSWKNEMVLLVANQNSLSASKPITYMTEKEGVIFKIQIKSSWKKIPESAAMFKGLPKVEYYHSDNLYKYTIGNFASQKACEAYIQLAAKQGFKDAFVVAFYKKNRISLEEAEKIMAAQ